MKKILSIATLFLLFLSCGKEPNTPDPGPSGGGSGSGGGDANEITDITLPAPLLLLDAAGDGGLLEVKLSPSGCTTDMLNVKVTPDDVVSWVRRSGGIFFTPKKIGEASVTLSAKSGPASSRQATVRVLSSEDYASTAISKITLSSSEVYLKEGDTQGKVVGVTLEPSSATSQMLKFSGASDLVTVSAVEGGIKFVPKKVGTGSVQVQPRKGSAAAQSVAVVVLSKDAYSDYVITNISSSPASVEVTDETTANVTLTLTPSAAALKDLIIASQDETVATVAQGSGTTLVVTGKKPGSTKILVRGIREGSKSIEIPVTVYGHVTSISFNAGERFDLIKGKTESLYYTIEKSGKMKNEPTVSWSATGSLVSVYGGKITGNAAGGDATYSTVTAKAGNCSASIKVYVYDTATGVEFDDIVGDFDLDGTSYNLKEGKSCSVTWRILPATAKQEYKSVEFVTGTAADASQCISTVKSGSSFKTTITYPANSHYGRRETYILRITPSSGNNNNNKGIRYFFFTEFYSTDLKPGDYVYYDSASKRFNWSDGGLRRLESDFYFNTTAAKIVSGLGTFIGKVYATTLPSDPEWNALASKPGFKNKAGKHACVLSSELALDTDNTNYFRWSEDDDDIFSEDEWTDGPHADAQTEYALKFQLVYYNNRVGGSHKIKPGYAVVNMDVKTFGTAALAHTGWMVPTKETAEKIVALGHSSSIFKDLTDLGIPYDYWTATQSSKTEAWCFNFSTVQVRAKDPTSNSLKPRLRPVLWL